MATILEDITQLEIEKDEILRKIHKADKRITAIDEKSHRVSDKDYSERLDEKVELEESKDNYKIELEMCLKNIIDKLHDYAEEQKKQGIWK